MAICTGCDEIACQGWEYLECACPCHNGPDDIECGEQDECECCATMRDTHNNKPCALCGHTRDETGAETQR